MHLACQTNIIFSPASQLKIVWNNGLIFQCLISILTVNRFVGKRLDSAAMFPGFHLPKLDFRHSFYPQTSVFPLSISPTDWSLFFVLAGNERAFVEVSGGLPDWLEFFRGKRAEWFWGFEFECETLGDVGHVGCWRKCTPRILCLLKQAQSVLIWVVLREAFPRNAQGMFAGVCAGAFESTGQLHSCTEPRDTLTLPYILRVGNSLI